MAILVRSALSAVVALAVTALMPATAAPAAPPPARTVLAPVALGDVVPAPVSVTPSAATFTLTSSTVIFADPSLAGSAQAGGYLAGALRPATGFSLPVFPPPYGLATAAGIFLLHGSQTGEAYQLDVAAQTVVITAGTSAGLFAGIQTLRQLLPAAIDSPTRQALTWTIPGGRITDAPRFAYRGAMLDVARHFFTVAQVERYIDQIARYKVNYLHLHLADDQGWRIEITSWPRLATYGGSTAVGGDSGGYYTQAQYGEIVRYAQARSVTVVPEIDLPGHTNAALASYPELNCDGVAPPLYTGIGVGFSSLCVSKPITYQFVEDVIRELAAITPGPYLHIGGDEAHSTPESDYLQFLHAVLPLVGKYGKTADGWHDYLKAAPAAGAVGEYWGFGGPDASVAAAAQAGSRIVMAPANRAYLDMKYDANCPLGLSWAGYTEVRDAYEWDPATYVGGVPASAVSGVEAPLWSETIRTSADIEYMAFPRLPAIAELGWSAPSVLGWPSFQRRLALQGPRWRAQGVNFYPSPQVPWPA
ncbi:MAG: nagZ [Actinomycetia bacterium]|nr:nagZ [Actinomycetes bacterium]